MASGFSGDGSKTERNECHLTSSLGSGDKQSILLNDKGDSVEGHAKAQDVDSVCKTHKKPHTEYYDGQLCSETCQKGQCIHLQSMEETIREKKQTLLNLQRLAREKSALWKERSDIIHQCKVATEDHLAALAKEVQSLIYKAPKPLLQPIGTKDSSAKRARTLTKCGEGFGKGPTIEDLLADVADIAEGSLTKLSDLQQQAVDALGSLDEAGKMIAQILQDDRGLVAGDQEVIMSLTEALGEAVGDSVAEGIARTVQSVRFVKVGGDGQYLGKIDGYGDRKWVLLEKVAIPQDVKEPVVAGVVGDDVIITDWEDGHTYAMKLGGKSTRKVVCCEGASLIVSCALMADGTIVCGSHEETSHGRITLYDNQWRSIKDIAIPSRRDWSWVDIALDRDGMIIAVQDQCDIYVINPGKGEIVSTIPCTVELLVRGVMTTGLIVAQPSVLYNRDVMLLLIDRSGNQTEIVHDRAIVNCSIDPVTDDVYLLHWIKQRRAFVVDHLSREGAVKGVDLLTFPLAKEQKGNEIAMPRWAFCYMTSAGKLVVFDGRRILIYKQRLSF